MLDLQLSRKQAAVATAVAAVCSCTTLAIVLPSHRAAGLLLVVTLTWASAVDFDRLVLPDILTIGLLIVGLGVGLDSGAFADALVAAIVGYSLILVVAMWFHHVRRLHGIGMGDAKLLAAAGAWLGLRELPNVLLLACVFGLLGFGALALVNRSVTRKTAIPFGPCIAFAFWLCWLRMSSATTVDAAFY